VLLSIIIMPSQAESFITPSKNKQTTHQKLHFGSMPTTFAAVTTNLLCKHQTEADEEDPDPLVDVKLLDFSKIKLPNSFSNKDKDALIKELAIQYTATFASESAFKMSLHYVSYKDIDAQHSNDIKPMNTKIKDNKDSFLHGLFQFYCTREQLHG
jgi:hypothetical protein